MHAKKLSPLDLCDAFLGGGARKNPLVSLTHVCEVLFDLDPDGVDPVTEDMEEFLYQFAVEHGGEMMINIREALRALDIWQSRVTSPALKSVSDHQSKATILDLKNKKLKELVFNLEAANLRLSRQLDSAKLARSPPSTEESSSPASSPKSRVRSKLSSGDFSSTLKATDTRKFSFQNEKSSSSGLQVVNLHEQELVEIASTLQFTGVQRLEQLLIEGDTDSTGFVSLEQLCLLLKEDFDLKISESRLIEVCMGMNFNSSGQLDYKEFVDVLMDILIYALPDIRESAKRKSIQRLDQYLQRGFPPEREDVRQLLDALCSKYDLERDQIIQIKDLVHVFHVDLVKYHELELPFPLQEQEIIQLARPFIQHKTFTISTRHFKRIFERHINPEDMETLAAALATPDDTQVVSNLRYDVLLKMVFGAPELHDQQIYEIIRKKLLRDQDRLYSLVKEMMTQRSSHELTIQDFSDTFIVRAETYPLTTIEMLYLFASLDSDHVGTVQVKTLNKFLTRNCWTTLSFQDGDIESVKKLIAKCCSSYDLQHILDSLGRSSHGWIPQATLVQQLDKMFRDLGVVGVRKKDLQRLVENVVQHTVGEFSKPSTRDATRVHCDAFFDALFDWNAVLSSVRLPDSLVEVKKVFETFDYKHNGTIRSEDWNKIYRVISLDTDKKGYFNAADLKAYLTKELFDKNKNEEDISSALLSSADALTSVMCLLAGEGIDSHDCSRLTISMRSHTAKPVKQSFLYYGFELVFLVLDVANRCL
ncbi:uncharacterized protein PITG_11846 [Phytophthora infestans T30-4]|uniref:EF-hand domain-containing protein n=1 Tax=Phytophthora infestans (strain T30-4) TaxID=403677 RepID=D0NHY4_PHYIT|nr:uncharacterized protein PITG_11846 [Phytophthora infestans T30-4]EEY58859.1 conserved hypothetical protein [Phytophthora infestans T30-4]|eukprot:XP_002901332.1 conserved hypothetical protein [Phytophthora infestans T30-4]